ncbi:MAG: hypothetical protein IKN36_05465 [Clostridia bacterium]|nr:hypothetical protein [Clostridia bacterium]
MIIYAHKGASFYAPENTMSSFHLGLTMGANAIETDIRMTADGELILSHDSFLGRKNSGSGKLRDLTLAQIRRSRAEGNSTDGFCDRITTLREFFEIFANRDIAFALDLKETAVAEPTLRMAEEFGILGKATFTSGGFDRLKIVKECNPAARVGWIIREGNEDEMRMLKEIGGEELVVFAPNTTAEKIARWREAGFGVRAWGVENITLMKRMCDLGVDGMTVDYPDRLVQYLNR